MSEFEQLMPLPPEGADLPKQELCSPDALQLDVAGVDEAAKAMGLYPVKARKLMAAYTLGKAIKQVGALKIGRTILLAAATNAQQSIESCDDIIENSEDEALILHALDTKQKLIRSQADVGSKFIKSVEVDGSDDAKPQSKIRAFEPGQAAGPVVIAQQAVVHQS